MKKIIGYIILSLLTIIECIAQHFSNIDITPKGFSGNFIQVVSLENKLILALADNDCLYISTDSARTWNVKEAPFKGVAQMKKFNDGIYLYNAETIYKSIDNGVSWNKFETNGIPKVLESYKMEYEHIFYKNTDTLFISATNRVNGSKIYRTTNGGRDWNLVAERLYGKNILDGVVSLHFVSSQKGYAFGAGYYAETNDGGATWTKQMLENYETYFYDGIVTNGVLIQSYASSSVIVSDLENVVLYKAGIHRFVSMQGKVIGIWDQTVHYTNDDGQTWQTKKNTEEDKFNDICCFDENVMIQVGRNLTSYVTVDGGETWTKYVHGGGEGFNDIYAKNDKECFLVGKTGRIFHTKDGGATWTWQDLNVIGLNSMTFPSQDTGYVVSNDIMLMTQNGGETWNQKINQHGGTFIDFVTPQIGFVGFIPNVFYLAKTKDAGNTWTVKTNKNYRENVNPYSFEFRNESEGLVTGNGNLLLHTTDGGQNWEIINKIPSKYNVRFVQNVSDKGWLISAIDDTVSDIFFCDNNFNCQMVFNGENQSGAFYRINDSVYYIPINGTFYISHDYGMTWEDANFDITGNYSFANEHFAYSFDSECHLYKTYINIRDMEITILQSQNRRIEIATNIEENVFANVFLKDEEGNLYSLFSNYEIKKDVPCVIDIPQYFSDGSYRLFIESLNSAYKDTESEPFEVSDETAVVDVSKNQMYRVQGKILYVYDSNTKLYSVLGAEIPLQNGMAELQPGVYVLKTAQGTEKIVVK